MHHVLCCKKWHMLQISSSDVVRHWLVHSVARPQHAIDRGDKLVLVMSYCKIPITTVNRLYNTIYLHLTTMSEELQ